MSHDHVIQAMEIGFVISIFKYYSALNLEIVLKEENGW